MSDFISKPFDVPTTIALIARLRRPSNLPKVGVHPVASAITVVQTECKEAGDVPVMDASQGMQVWKDMHAYRAYLRRFVEGYSGAVDTMNASLTANDVAGAAALAHKLAGVAANLALPDTHRLASEAERVLSNGYDATQVLERLSHSLAQTVAAIAQFVAPAVQAENSILAQPPCPAAPPMSPESLKAVLLALMAALDTDNPDPAFVQLALLETQVSPSELAPIRACVQDYDFRRAEAATLHLAGALGLAFKE